MGKHLCGDRCPCSRVQKIQKANYPVLSPEVVKQCPLEVLEQHQTTLGNDSWLSTREEAGEPFAVGCVICATTLSEGDKDVFARFEVTKVEAMKPYRLQNHQDSLAHTTAVLRLLQPSSDAIGLPVKTQTDAPPVASFEVLLAHLRKGGSLRDGVPSVGHFVKVKSMTFCLAESLKRLYRTWLRGSCTINLLRDERNSRLLVRFRCSDLAGHRHIGVIGQAKIIKSTATNITQQTRDLVIQFVTRNWNAPYLKSDRQVQEVDALLFEHIRHHIHAITIDSASDEVASAENMMCVNSDSSFHCPGLRTILRDKAHASRRILQRPWSCDSYLSMIASTLISESGSLAQMIQRSADLKAWYEEACSGSTSGVVSTVFTHMRAAKHRYESLASPLCRMALNWKAVIRFLERVSIERQSEGAGVYATASLAAIDEELILQAALLADACSLVDFHEGIAGVPLQGYHCTIGVSE